MEGTIAWENNRPGCLWMLDQQLQIPLQPAGLNTLWQVLDERFDSFVLRG